jgi:hypothetical protein
VLAAFKHGGGGGEHAAQASGALVWGVRHKAAFAPASARAAAVRSLPFVASSDKSVLAAAGAIAAGALADSDAGVRRAAVDVFRGGLLPKGDPAALTAVLAASAAPLPGPREAALLALPSLAPRGHAGATAALCARLLDSDWAVRREAAQAAALVCPTPRASRREAVRKRAAARACCAAWRGARGAGR